MKLILRYPRLETLRDNKHRHPGKNSVILEGKSFERHVISARVPHFRLHIGAQENSRRVAKMDFFFFLPGIKSLSTPGTRGEKGPEVGMGDPLGRDKRTIRRSISSRAFSSSRLVFQLIPGIQSSTKSYTESNPCSSEF